MPDPTHEPAARMPRQIPYIIATEGCERFSFYGMRNILVAFLVGSVLLQHLPAAGREGAAKEIFHTFVIGVYFFPLLGGWLADRFFGKYDTTFWLSLVYCAGHGCLAAFEDSRTGFFAGLFLIALGSGGIKPLVASFVGDQFDQTNKHLAKTVFDAFYWIINFGSLFATLLMPILLRDCGASIAFGVPGVLMFIATIVYWAGRKQYVVIPPAPPNPDAFLAVVRTALVTPAAGRGRPGLVLAVVSSAVAAVALVLGLVGLVRGMHGIPVVETIGVVSTLCLALVAVLVGGGAGAWIQLERARGAHPDAAVDGVRSVLRILVVFALVTPFWSLFDQKASTWVIATGAMAKPSWFEPSQLQALNPLLVVILIPLNNLVVFPALRRRGWDLRPLRKMTVGIALAGLSWIAIGLLQVTLDGGTSVSIVWMLVPYVLLTVGEVLVSATGLEFAYSQAPGAMKGVIMSFWSLAVTIGNLWVLLANTAVKNAWVTERIADTGMSIGAFQMFFFAAFAFAAALAFGWFARRYTMVDHYRGGGGVAEPAPQPQASVVDE